MLKTAKGAKLPLLWRAFFVLFYSLFTGFIAFLLRDLKIYVALAGVLFMLALPFIGTTRMREMRAKREWVLVFCIAFMLRVLNVNITFSVLKIGAAIFFLSLIVAWIYLVRELQRSKRGLPAPETRTPVTGRIPE